LVKQMARSLFVFIQTHPEYDHDTLLREYRRDVTRFHAGQQTDCPRLPRNYFDRQTTAELETSPVADASLKMLQQAAPDNGWRPMAVQLYRNWLHYLLTPVRMTPCTGAVI
jgi:homoserine O-succinyltransferase